MKRILDIVRGHWLLLSALLLAVITTLSLLPLPALPEVPGNDKIHHYLAYASLMLPLALRRPTGWLLIGLLFLAWSGVIELIQPYVNRYGEWADLAANAAGLFTGMVIARLLDRMVGEGKASS